MDRLALVFQAPVLEAHDQRHRQLRIVAIKVREIRTMRAEVAAALPQELLPAGDIGRGFIEVADAIEQWWGVHCHWRGPARLSVGPEHGTSDAACVLRTSRRHPPFGGCDCQMTRIVSGQLRRGNLNRSLPPLVARRIAKQNE